MVLNSGRRELSADKDDGIKINKLSDLWDFYLFVAASVTKSISLLEGPQAMQDRPSNEDIIRTKTLEC
jgi:hypothetical protein